MSQHVSGCPIGNFGGSHTDAARRASDQWNLHRVANPYGSIGQWMAVRLDDGSSDGTLYETKGDAIRHQVGMEFFYTYMRLSLATANACDMEIYLATHRKMYDKGLRMVDPAARNGGPDLIKRTNRDDMVYTMRGRPSNLIIPGRD